MKKYVRLSVLTFSLLSLTLAFQNCSEVKFKKTKQQPTTVESVSETPAPQILPPQIFFASVDKTEFGSPMNFSVLAQGDNLIYQWYKSKDADSNLELISAASSFGYKIDVAAVEDTGFYYVKVSNSVGSVTSDPIPVTIVQPKDMTDFCTDSGGSVNGTTCTFSKKGAFTLSIEYDVENVEVTVIGAGGGLGTRDHSHWNCYGGAGGGAAIKKTDLLAGNYSINIGTGGSSVSRWGFHSGGNGGSSKFTGSGINMSATGGEGGYRNGYGRGASAGMGSGGDQNCQGGNGRNANYTYGKGEAGKCNGGAGGYGSAGGGASKYGGDGFAGTYYVKGNKVTSGVCGAGSGKFGARGADGCVIITWTE